MRSDEQLVEAFLAGDQQAFAGIYDRYARPIHDFGFAMLRNRDEAADVMQDTFVTAAERMQQLRDPTRLKAWLYAIARSHSLHRLRARRRVTPTDDLPEVATSAAGPDTEASQDELRELVWAAAAGLGDRDRALLDLHVRQGLDGAELAAAIGTTPANAYVLLSRLRDQVERSLGALLVARTGRNDCPALRQVLDGWDGRFTSLMRKRVARHVDDCPVCSDRRNRLASPVELLSGVGAVALPLELRSDVLGRVAAGSAGPPLPLDSSGFPKPPAALPPVAGLAVGAAAAVLLLAGGVLVVAHPFSASTAQTRTAAKDRSLAITLTPSDTAPGTSTTTQTRTPTQTDSSRPPGAATSVPPTSIIPLTTDVAGLDFGLDQATRSVTVTNPGPDPVAWSAAPDQSWVAVTPASGTVQAGGTQVLTVAIDRSIPPDGAASAAVDITSSVGPVSVTVAASIDHPPTVSDVTLAASQLRTSPSACDPTTSGATVQASDGLGVARVVLSWTLTQQLAGVPHVVDRGSGPMDAGPSGAYSRTVGPFTRTGSLAVWAVATDTGGHDTSSPVTVISVVAGCIG